MTQCDLKYIISFWNCSASSVLARSCAASGPGHSASPSSWGGSSSTWPSLSRQGRPSSDWRQITKQYRIYSVSTESREVMLSRERFCATTFIRLRKPSELQHGRTWGKFPASSELCVASCFSKGTFDRLFYELENLVIFLRPPLPHIGYIFPIGRS